MKKIFQYSMSAIYLIAGLFLLIQGWFLLNPFQNRALGALLIVYGAFRAYRIYKSELARKLDETDENTIA